MKSGKPTSRPVTPRNPPIGRHFLDESAVASVISVDMRRRAALLGLVLTLPMFTKADLLACSCARVQPVCEAAWKADAVFVGTVTDIEPPSILGVFLAWVF